MSGRIGAALRAWVVVSRRPGKAGRPEVVCGRLMTEAEAARAAADQLLLEPDGAFAPHRVATRYRCRRCKDVRRVRTVRCWRCKSPGLERQAVRP